MITEKLYDNPQEVGYLSSFQDGDKCIGFRKLDGEFLACINGVTAVDIANVSREALHQLETLDGLYVHDGKPDEQWQIEVDKLDTLRHVVDQLTASA